MVKADEQIEDTSLFIGLGNVESTLLVKIDEINQRIQNEKDIEELQKLNTVMATLLDNLNRVRKIRRRRT